MNITIIISATLADAAVEYNREATRDLQEDLKDLGFEYIACKGSFEGVTEKSFIVPTKLGHLGTLQELARDYSQQCILVINQKDHSCYFVGSNQSEIDWAKPAGKWIRKAKKPDGDYTVVYTAVDPIYYTVEK